jgi:hypothetical protein
MHCSSDEIRQPSILSTDNCLPHSLLTYRPTTPCIRAPLLQPPPPYIPYPALMGRHFSVLCVHAHHSHQPHSRSDRNFCPKCTRSSTAPSCPPVLMSRFVLSFSLHTPFSFSSVKTRMRMLAVDMLLATAVINEWCQIPGTFPSRTWYGESFCSCPLLRDHYLHLHAVPYPISLLIFTCSFISPNDATQVPAHRWEATQNNPLSAFPLCVIQSTGRTLSRFVDTIMFVQLCTQIPSSHVLTVHGILSSLPACRRACCQAFDSLRLTLMKEFVQSAAHLHPQHRNYRSLRAVHPCCWSATARILCAHASLLRSHLELPSL